MKMILSLMLMSTLSVAGVNRSLLTGSSSGPLWYPTDFSGSQIGFDYKDRAGVLAPSNFTKDGSNNISQWNDLSGNSRHATQSTGGLQPLYTASGVQFNGSSQFLNLGTFRIVNDTSDWSIGVVTQATTVDVTQRAFFDLETASDNHCLEMGITTLTGFSDVYAGSTFEWAPPASTTLAVSNTTNVHNYVILYHGISSGHGNWTYYVDGSTQSITAPGSSLDAGLPPSIGKLFAGYVRTLWVYNSKLGGGDLTNFQSFLTRRTN